MTQTMPNAQSGVLEEIPAHGRYLEYQITSPQEVAETLTRLSRDVAMMDVIGFGAAIFAACKKENAFVPTFPGFHTSAVSVPATQNDLWVWIRDDNPGAVAIRARQIDRLVGQAFVLSLATNAFKYDIGRDLTGYEDGTENPEGADAVVAALASDADRAPVNSTFVAVQKWQHDMRAFAGFEPADQDFIIGRRLVDNEELDDAPESAHVKRTAQEDFDPEAFLVRRSMPWSDGSGEGLMFVAFGHSVQAFEQQMQRMVGMDDGIIDGLFRFSAAVSGSYFWCPPRTEDGLDLSPVLA